jgi:hypothetical protein
MSEHFLFEVVVRRQIWVSLFAIAACQGKVESDASVASARPLLDCPPTTRIVSNTDGAVCVQNGSASQNVFQGPARFVFTNGKRRHEGQYVDGKKEGAWTRFDPDGNRVELAFFSEGELNGPRIEFFPSGQKRLEETYAGGKRQGRQTLYRLDGDVETQTEFAQDRAPELLGPLPGRPERE